jgi:16S rRNA processing protein RimM
LLVRPLSAHPERAFEPGKLLFMSELPNAAPIAVTAARTTKDGWLLSLEGVADRTTADTWRGRYLWGDGDPENPDEPPFAADLVGMRMELNDGSTVGTVSDFYDLPQGPILEITREEDTVLFPVRPEFVSSIDRERNVIVVDPPPGLFD